MTLLESFINAALELQEEGVKAITGACGFMALFQREVSDVVEVPVLLSSLLQIPFIYQTLSRKRKIGIVTADSKSLTSDHFISIGVSDEIPLVIRGMEDQKEFREAILEEKGSLDSDLIENEVLSVASQRSKGISYKQPRCWRCYTSGIQSSRIYFTTMIQYVHAALVREEFRGFM